MTSSLVIVIKSPSIERAIAIAVVDSVILDVIIISHFVKIGLDTKIVESLPWNCVLYRVVYFSGTPTPLKVLNQVRVSSLVPP